MWIIKLLREELHRSRAMIRIGADLDVRENVHILCFELSGD